MINFFYFFFFTLNSSIKENISYLSKTFISLTYKKHQHSFQKFLEFSKKFIPDLYNFSIHCNKPKQINTDTWAYVLAIIPFLVKSNCTYIASLSCMTIFTCTFPITITSLTLRTSLVTVACYKVEKVNQKHTSAYQLLQDG